MAGGGRRLASGLRPREGGGAGGGGSWLPFAPATWGAALERKRSLEARQRAAGAGARTVAAALPGHVAAQREVLGAVAGELTGAWGAQGFRSEPLGGGGGLKVSLPDGMSVSWDGCDEAGCGGALGAAAMCLEEDLALMAPLEPGGPYCLVAAHICTSFGDLPDRMGRSLTRLHDPVPGYREDVGAPMEALFERMRPGGSGMWRTNWGLQYDSDPDPAESARRPSSEDLLERFERDGVGGCTWLRVEFQNVRKLAESGAVLFTIRTYIEPLAGCRGEGGAAAANLASNIRALSPPLTSYKGLDEAPIREAVLRYLDGDPGSGPGGERLAR